MKSLKSYLTPMIKEQAPTNGSKYSQLNTAFLAVCDALEKFDRAASAIDDNDSFWNGGPDANPDEFGVLSDIQALISRLNNNNPSKQAVSDVITDYVNSQNQQDDSDDSEQSESEPESSEDQSEQY